MDFTLEQATGFPVTIASFNLTRACNLTCDYCFTNGCTKGDMPKDIAFRAVDFLINNALKCRGQERAVEVSFWGGEPLLKWSLLQEIVLYAQEKAAKVAVPVNFGGTTNGTLLTPEKFDFLDKHKIFFMISFDGTEESQNYHRKFGSGMGSHKKVVKNIKSVLAKWPFYRIRMSPFAQRIDHFYEDMKYIFDLGCEYIMFSPVYESNFTEEHWKIWENECYKVIDYMAELRANGKKAEVEHFKSYTGKDNSRWPCGAGRFYVGIDIDGAIYPCHRFNKFDDNRPWQEKEVCIGHIDHGITNPKFRELFINFVSGCGDCPRKQDTPCNGGCYAVNFDFTKDITKPYQGLCRYVEMQKKVSMYYKEKLGMSEKEPRSCICDFQMYTGPEVDGVPLPTPQNAQPIFTVEEKKMLRAIIMDIDRRLKRLEEKVGL